MYTTYNEFVTYLKFFIVIFVVYIETNDLTINIKVFIKIFVTNQYLKLKSFDKKSLQIIYKIKNHHYNISFLYVDN